MPFPDPNNLFLECLQNPEPLIDEAYCCDELIIFKNSYSQPTEIMQAHSTAIERICAAKLAKNDERFDEYEKHIQSLDKLLMECKQAQFLELTSFFPAMDVSFSAYKKLVSNKRITFLKDLLLHFLNRRHDIYMSHGYSVTTNDGLVYSSPKIMTFICQSSVIIFF